MRSDLKLLLLVDQNNAIAKDGQQILFIPEDLQHFKKLTENQIVIMGRKTYEATGGNLPNRINFVLSSKKQEDKENVFFVKNLEELSLCLKDFPLSKNVFCIGGAKLVDQLFPFLEEAILTRIDTIIPMTDTFIPDLRKKKDWELRKKIGLPNKKVMAWIEYWKKIK